MDELVIACSIATTASSGGGRPSLAAAAGGCGAEGGRRAGRRRSARRARLPMSTGTPCLPAAARGGEGQLEAAGALSNDVLRGETVDSAFRSAKSAERH